MLNNPTISITNGVGRCRKERVISLMDRRVDNCLVRGFLSTCHDAELGIKSLKAVYWARGELAVSGVSRELAEKGANHVHIGTTPSFGPGLGLFSGTFFGWWFIPFALVFRLVCSYIYSYFVLGIFLITYYLDAYKLEPRISQLPSLAILVMGAQLWIMVRQLLSKFII